MEIRCVSVEFVDKRWTLKTRRTTFQEFILSQRVNILLSMFEKLNRCYLQLFFLCIFSSIPKGLNSDSGTPFENRSVFRDVKVSHFGQKEHLRVSEILRIKCLLQQRQPLMYLEMALTSYCFAGINFENIVILCVWTFRHLNVLTDSG